MWSITDAGLLPTNVHILRLQYSHIMGSWLNCSPFTCVKKKLCITHHIQYQFFRICLSWFSTKWLDYLSIKMIFSFDAESELSPIQSCFELSILIILVSTCWISEVGDLNNVWFKFHAFSATHCLSFAYI